MVFHQISHNRTADAVVEQLESLILQGILRSGDRLPAERELAKKVDVSRPILREAIKKLEERGLVTSRHGEGTFISDVIGTVFSDQIVDLIRRHPRAVADYLEFRREVEGTAAELAALRATAADKEILTRLFTGMEEAHGRGDFDAEAAIDVEFHNAVGESAHNMILLHTLRACYRLLSDGVFYNRMTVYAFPGARENLLSQHRAIYEAIISGDPVASRLAAEAHIDYVETTMREVQRAGDWETVAALRLQQMAERSSHMSPSPARKRRTASDTRESQA
ncbi:MAG: GntR family transcriptional regulator [Hyphomicrobiales bacterium]|nr:MAG: GntR family transcriptional regulator [Hyphomicrobiales bacterium]